MQKSGDGIYFFLRISRRKSPDREEKTEINAEVNAEINGVGTENMIECNMNKSNRTTMRPLGV